MRLISRKDGFTLIEIILAIIIISIGVLGLVSAISFTSSKGINAEVITTAHVLAQECMENLIAEKRANGYGAGPLAIGTTIDPPACPAFTGYPRTVEICNVDGNLANPDCTAPDNVSGYKRITVSINYTGLADLPTPVVSLVSVVTDVRE